MSSNNRQVYSSDSKLNTKCPNCKELLAECVCADDDVVDLSKIQAVLSIEKAGRAGKTVTIVSRLPKSSSFLKELLSELKTRCGAGGSSGTDAKRLGFIEIQGDHRDAIRTYLTTKKKIKVKN